MGVRSASVMPNAQSSTWVSAGVPVVGPGEDVGPGQAHQLGLAQVAREQSGLLRLAMAERVQAELAQDQRAVADQVLQAEQIVAKRRMIVQINVECHEIEEGEIEILRGGVTGVGDQAVGVGLFDHVRATPRGIGRRAACRASGRYRSEFRCRCYKPGCWGELDRFRPRAGRSGAHRPGLGDSGGSRRAWARGCPSRWSSRAHRPDRATTPVGHDIVRIELAPSACILARSSQNALSASGTAGRRGRGRTDHRSGRGDAVALRRGRTASRGRERDHGRRGRHAIR